MLNYYAVQTFSLDRKPIRCTEHRTITGAWRAYRREMRATHPEGEGPQKPWTRQGARVLLDRDSFTGEITAFEVD